MTKTSSLALNAARRQKRLKYWQNCFQTHSLNPEYANKIGELLDTYPLLITKLLKADSTEDALKTEERLAGIERELNSAFEDRRLLTSEIGLAAIKTE